MSLCDYFLWGIIKSKKYETSIDSTEEPKKRNAEIQWINQDTLQNVWVNTKSRLDYIIQLNTGHRK